MPKARVLGLSPNGRIVRRTIDISGSDQQEIERHNKAIRSARKYRRLAFKGAMFAFGAGCMSLSLRLASHAQNNPTKDMLVPASIAAFAVATVLLTTGGILNLKKIIHAIKVENIHSRAAGPLGLF